MNIKHTKEGLRQLQCLPLNKKVQLSEQRAIEWVDKYGESKCYIAFSGGKDSTVLRHIIKKLFPNIPAVFCDTGLEHKHLREFALNIADEIIKPEMTFKQVIQKYGYPFPTKQQANAIRTARLSYNEDFLRNKLGINGNVKYMISKRYLPLLYAPFIVSDSCCKVMKKNPFKKYSKQTGRDYGFIGTMAQESISRERVWMEHGCNAYDTALPKSSPLSFWTDQDILEYIYKEKINIAPEYGDIVIDGGGIKLLV